MQLIFKYLVTAYISWGAEERKVGEQRERK